MSGKIYIDDKTWQALQLKVAKIGQMHAKVGILFDDDHGDFGMVELMAVHEYGSPAAGIPERAPIRRTFEENEDKVGKFCARLAKEVVEGRMTGEEALNLLGAFGVNELKKFIVAGKATPELAEETIRRKGSSTPLIDTGRLLNAITWLVETIDA